jgi:hypothetical protein
VVQKKFLLRAVLTKKSSRVPQISKKRAWSATTTKKVPKRSRVTIFFKILEDQKIIQGKDILVNDFHFFGTPEMAHNF